MRAVWGTSWAFLGLSWDFLEAFWGLLGPLGAVLGSSWGFFGRFGGHLGRCVVQDPSKNSQRTPQELPKTAPRGLKRPQKAAKRVPRDPQEGPRGPQHTPQTASNYKYKKTSKMTTLSMKINDFGGSKPLKFNQNLLKNHEK